MKFEFTRSLPGIKWVVSEIFQAICIENRTFIRHLTDADNSMPNAYFSKAFSRRHSFGLFAKDIATLKIQNSTFIPMYGYFWNSPMIAILDRNSHHVGNHCPKDPFTQSISFIQ